MNHLGSIRDKYRNSDMKAEEDLKQIFDTYLMEKSVLKLHGLEIIYVDYGLHRLYQNGEFLNEGEEHYCLERAYEIIYK
jgi:hypothetical protein